MYRKFVATISANRRLWIVLLVFAALPFLIKTTWSSSSAQSPDSTAQEREFKLHREYKNMPLEVRAVRNLQSENWLKDLEIEIKNVGRKPIYFVLGYLLFPDDKSAERVGIRLMYGHGINAERQSEPADPHLDPGEVYTFKIDEDFQKGFERRTKESPGMYKKFEFWLTIIGFGDGTSFENGENQDYRKKTSLESGSEWPSKKKASAL